MADRMITNKIILAPIGAFPDLFVIYWLFHDAKIAIVSVFPNKIYEMISRPKSPINNPSTIGLESQV